MRPREQALGERLDSELRRFSANVLPLPGIADERHRSSLVEQLVESIRRVRYIEVIQQRPISPRRGDPDCELFDPLRAAVLANRAGDREEAFWLTFLSVHFGKHRRAGWRLTRDVYAGKPVGPWTWNRLRNDVSEFRRWLEQVVPLWQADTVERRFGNHRKYESLKAWSNRGTGAVVESYVGWIDRYGTHDAMIRSALGEAHGSRGEAFDLLYRGMMAAVMSFGRTACFDYLTMVRKLRLADIEAPRCYLGNATGPLTGAKLLFGSNRARPSRLDAQLGQLGQALGVGCQVLEDALCNWQKSPGRFSPFRG